MHITWAEFVEGFSLRGGDAWIPYALDDSVTTDVQLSAIKAIMDDRNYTLRVSAGGGYRSSTESIHGIITERHPGSLQLLPAKDRRDVKVAGSSSGRNNNLADVIPSLEQRRVVVLSALRPVSPISHHGTDEYIDSNAGNLPTVLSNLQNYSPGKFIRFLDKVNEVFPSIKHVSIATVPPTLELKHGGLEVRIWSRDNHDKLTKSVSLADSGTGVGQAMAILYVAISYPSAVLVIDEINSFLHPTALKRLLRILKDEYSHHQYVLSAHSTDVIAWTGAKRVIIARKPDEEVVLEHLQLDEVTTLQAVAAELGVSMADMFGADRILWVEGETEEIAFPKLFKGLGIELPKGVVISPVIATGDLTLGSKGVDLAFKLYEKISGLAAPLVRDAVFSFDRESMKPEDVERLKAKASGNLYVLPRRMIENYAIHGSAIGHLLRTLGVAMTDREVESWIERAAGDQKYRAPTKWSGDMRSEVWLADVDGAGLIYDLVQDASDSKQAFSKTSHTPLLLDWLMENDPGHIAGLTSYLRTLGAAVGGSGASNP